MNVSNTKHCWFEIDFEFCWCSTAKYTGNKLKLKVKRVDVHLFHIPWEKCIQSLKVNNKKMFGLELLFNVADVAELQLLSKQIEVFNPILGCNILGCLFDTISLGFRSAPSPIIDRVRCSSSTWSSIFEGFSLG